MRRGRGRRERTAAERREPYRFRKERQMEQIFIRDLQVYGYHGVYLSLIHI